MLQLIVANEDKILELQNKPTILISNLCLTDSDLPLFEKLLISHIGSLKQELSVIYSVTGEVLRRAPKELCFVLIPLDIFITSKDSLQDIGLCNSHWLSDFL